ncbi:hypothetical protein [Salinimicrobium oceani]|uniref:Nuclear transport factor 2 family protein n=1 Tax=Salinimicrobium oceani TaxID=2722702 RepID=A0ABX1CTE2_9FLAO|nr:hypothetical protein [Salinimicrobium oceani]NJW51550.1 hypothetical protein [Salinimicrobium oceani]
MRICYTFIFLFFLVSLPEGLRGQENLQKQRVIAITSEEMADKNHILVNEIYEMLQDKNRSVEDMQALTSEINWKQTEVSKRGISRYKINMSSIMQSGWTTVLFEDLRFETTDRKEVLVTGIVNGRQPAECDFISHDFEHYWLVKNDKVVGFRE